MRPFKRIINLIQMLIIEVIVFIMNICMLVLIRYLVLGVGDPKKVIMTGDVVILGNDIMNLVFIVFFVIKFILEAIRITKENRAMSAKGSQGKTAYVQLLGLFAQQSSMGFEELLDDYSSKSIDSLHAKKPGVIEDKSSDKFDIDNDIVLEKDVLDQDNKVFPELNINKQVRQIKSNEGAPNLSLKGTNNASDSSPTRKESLDTKANVLERKLTVDVALNDTNTAILKTDKLITAGGKNDNTSSAIDVEVPAMQKGKQARLKTLTKTKTLNQQALDEQENIELQENL